MFSNRSRATLSVLVFNFFGIFSSVVPNQLSTVDQVNPLAQAVFVAHNPEFPSLAAKIAQCEGVVVDKGNYPELYQAIAFVSAKINLNLDLTYVVDDSFEASTLPQCTRLKVPYVTDACLPVLIFRANQIAGLTERDLKLLVAKWAIWVRDDYEKRLKIASFCVAGTGFALHCADVYWMWQRYKDTPSEARTVSFWGKRLGELIVVDVAHELVSTLYLWHRRTVLEHAAEQAAIEIVDPSSPRLSR